MPPPLPSQPGGSVGGDVGGPVNIQNPFSDGGPMPGGPPNYQRPGYGPMGGVPGNAGNYDGRSGVPYSSRQQPPFVMGHQGGEQFDNSFGNQDGVAVGPSPFPANAR